jgi:hypothetical protein
MMDLNLTTSFFNHILLFQSKPLYPFVHDLRNEVQYFVIIRVKTYSQLLLFHLLVGHVRIIGVELESLGLQTLDKLLLV